MSGGRDHMGRGRGPMGSALKGGGPEGEDRRGGAGPDGQLYCAPGGRGQMCRGAEPGAGSMTIVIV